MNKFGIVVGIAAVATLAGCKDPNYKHAGAVPSQTEVKSSGEAVPVETASSCKCAPGAKHAEPCACGAADCKCVVEPAPAPAPVEPAPQPEVKPEPVQEETTDYIVQPGDYLAKISKRYNVTIAAIRRLNPSLKGDVIRVGQKLKLPGAIDVGPQKAPAKSDKPAAKSAAKKAAADYTGPTREYVVKSGDTLGALAYGNGINIRQLKKLNGLSGDTLKVGQKLKLPAEKPVAAAPAAKKSAPAPKVETKPAAKPAAEPVAAAETPAPAETQPAEAPAAEPQAAAPAAEPATANPTYVVQEGDDITGVSIRWGISTAVIRELNNLGENDQLVPGQIIKLPAEVK